MFNPESTINAQGIQAKSWLKVGALSKTRDSLLQQVKLLDEKRNTSELQVEAASNPPLPDAKARASFVPHSRPHLIPIPRFLLAHPSYP